MHRQSKQLPQDLTYERTPLIIIGMAEADEAYVIGRRGQYTPVGAYLAGDEIIKIAVQHGVQMIHPGMNQGPVATTLSNSRDRLWIPL